MKPEEKETFIQREWYNRRRGVMHAAIIRMGVQTWAAKQMQQDARVISQWAQCWRKGTNVMTGKKEKENAKEMLGVYFLGSR